MMAGKRQIREASLVCAKADPSMHYAEHDVDEEP